MVVMDNRIAESGRLAESAESLPNRTEPARPEQALPRRLIEYLKGPIHCLDDLVAADGSVWVGWITACQRDSIDDRAVPPRSPLRRRRIQNPIRAPAAP